MKYVVSFIFMISTFMFIGCAGITNNKSDTEVLIVGMQNSKAYGVCEGCEKDANRMKTLLSPYAKKVTVLKSEQATVGNVRQHLQSGSQKKTFIFFYSGHGGQRGTSDKTEPDRKDEHLCLYDGMILDNELWNIACSSKGKVMYIFDACHSETMYRALGEQLEELSKSARGDTPNLLCWSGCHDESYSYGSNLSGGTFTSAIYNSYNPKLTYSKMWKKIENRMPSDQKPVKTEMGKGWKTFVFH